MEFFFTKIVNVDYFRKKAPSEMFDWVLDMPLPLDYLRGLSSLCVHIIFPECFKDVISRLQCR